jgi:hypothetical protein
MSTITNSNIMRVKRHEKESNINFRRSEYSSNAAKQQRTFPAHAFAIQPPFEDRAPPQSPDMPQNMQTHFQLNKPFKQSKNNNNAEQEGSNKFVRSHIHQLALRSSRDAIPFFLSRVISW